jgi:hypothetical protein
VAEMALSIVPNEPVLSSDDGYEHIKASPFAAVRCAQGRIEMHKLQLDYEPKIAVLDVVLSAARIHLLSDARRLQEASDKAVELKVGEDISLMGVWSTRALWICILLFEIVLGYLSMSAIVL